MARVSFVVACAFVAGVTDAGEKVQMAPAGKPEQAKVTGWLKPPEADTDKVKPVD